MLSQRIKPFRLAAAVGAFVAFACLGFISRPCLAEPGSVKQLAPGVYVWQGDREKREPANCTWIIFKDYVVVIDANFPWGAEEILPRIKATTNKPIRFVLNTHYHGDHAYGNALFVREGAMIISSEATSEESKTRGAQAWKNWNEPHSLKDTHQELPTLTFSDRFVLDDGTQRVEMLRLGPAHSMGDSVAYLPHQKIVVTGDLCVTWPHGNNTADAGGSYKGWLGALDRMSTWDVQTVIPGHGEIAGPEALHAQRAYLDAMVTQVRSARAAGKKADELINSMDFRPYGLIATDATANANSLRSMYRRFDAGGD